MNSNSTYFDALETRSVDEREHALFSELPHFLSHAKRETSAYGELYSDLEVESFNSREKLADLPVLRKTELVDRQRKNPPFGGLVVDNDNEVFKVFSSPGPIHEPQGKEPDFWRMSRALFAAGFRPGDLVFNTFSYHFTPAGAMLDGGAQALGCTVFPAGVGQTEAQIQALADLTPNGYVGTPSFLNILLARSQQEGIDTSHLTKALVSGEALPDSLRQEIEEYGVSILQCYATADLGLIAYESPAKEGMISDEGIILEIVHPGTGDPVLEGEVGEVVVTTFNRTYPLIRFATGDLSAIMPGQSSCGRTNHRIRGWMGRADQVTKIRGMFIHPLQIQTIINKHDWINRARLVVDRDGHNDRMTLHCEVNGGVDQSLADEVAGTIRQICKLRGSAEFVEFGSLPDDGKLIEDLRSYK